MHSWMLRVLAHDLDRRHAAGLLLVRQQAQRDDRLQVLREARAHLELLLGREERDQAVDRGGDVRGVDRGEDHVTGLGGLERGVDRLEVAHLADHDHVGILAQRARAARRGRCACRCPIFALRDDALVVREHELDRILDRDDLRLPDPVHLFDHRRERGRLAHAGRARHEHVAARICARSRSTFGRLSSSKRADLERDHAQHDVVEAALARDVDAEAALARKLEGEVDLVEVHRRRGADRPRAGCFAIASVSLAVSTL